MSVEDFGRIEVVHWSSPDQVREFIDRQGIASMLAFSGVRCVGQLYVRAYDTAFSESGGWTGDWPWADFRIAEPLSLPHGSLTLGCYHVGRRPTGEQDPSLWGHGIATKLLEAVVAWFEKQDRIGRS